MTRSLFRGALVVTAALVPSISVAAVPGDVWTVGSVGADFTELQAAVDAAADGDLILVRPGDYAKFQALGRSLTVVAETPGSVQIAGPLRISQLTAGQRFALIDLVVSGDGESALILNDNAGSVRVHGGHWSVVDASVVWWESERAAVRLIDCDDVELREATLVGHDGVGAIASPISGPGSGGSGIDAQDSNLALYHCSLSGGDGGSDFIEEGYSGGWGGHGLAVHGGFAHVVNCTLSGGDGGHGGEEDGIPPFYNRAGDGGDGGDGLHAAGGNASAVVRVMALTASGGSGGAAGLGFWEEDGQPGQPGVPVETLGNVAYSTLPGPVVRLIADGLWRPGTPETLWINGTPGSDVVLAVSPKADFSRVDPKQGVLLLGGKPALKPLGKIPAGGKLTLTLTAFGLPAGWQGRTLELQAWVAEPGGPTMLSGSSTTAIIDPSI